MIRNLDSGWKNIISEPAAQKGRKIQQGRSSSQISTVASKFFFTPHLTFLVLFFGRATNEEQSKEPKLKSEELLGTAFVDLRSTIGKGNDTLPFPHKIDYVTKKKRIRGHRTDNTEKPPNYQRGIS